MSIHGRRCGKLKGISRTCYVSSDSDSDDDVPLSLLRAKVEPKVEAEAATEKVKVEAPTRGADTTKRQTAPKSDSDDDVPISGLVKRQRLKAETKVKQEQVGVPAARSTAPKRTPRKGKKRVIQVSATPSSLWDSKHTVCRSLIRVGAD